MTAPADLGSSKGLGFGFGLGLGSGLGLGLSGSTCKVDIDNTRPAQFFAQDAAAYSGSRFVPFNLPHALIFVPENCRFSRA